MESHPLNPECRTLRSLLGNPQWHSGGTAGQARSGTPAPGASRSRIMLYQPAVAPDTPAAIRFAMESHPLNPECRTLRSLLGNPQ
jgi:hypothetical protein